MSGRIAVLVAVMLPLLGSGGVPAVAGQLPLSAGGLPAGDHISVPGQGWSPAAPLASPVVDLDRLLDTSRSPETRSGPDETSGTMAAEAGVRTALALRRAPLPVNLPRRPAGAFRPHQANAPPATA